MYKFSYAVKDGYSGNQFGHTENRFGVETVGTYHVLLPDGRLQTVSYTGNLPEMGFSTSHFYASTNFRLGFNPYFKYILSMNFRQGLTSSLVL